MVRMRTISQTISYLKEKDPNTSITEWRLRKMLKTGQLKFHMAGNKYLVNLDYLEEFFNGFSKNETEIENTKGG